MDRLLNKIKWIKRTAVASFGILAVTLLINYFRTPLLGLEKGYAPDNFVFNFTFFLPAMLVSLVLGFASFGRILKHWKEWNDLNKKLILIGLSIPIILLWIFLIIRLFIN